MLKSCFSKIEIEYYFAIYPAWMDNSGFNSLHANYELSSQSLTPPRRPPSHHSSIDFSSNVSLDLDGVNAKSNSDCQHQIATQLEGDSSNNDTRRDFEEPQVPINIATTVRGPSVSRWIQNSYVCLLPYVGRFCGWPTIYSPTYLCRSSTWKVVNQMQDQLQHCFLLILIEHLNLQREPQPT